MKNRQKCDLCKSSFNLRNNKVEAQCVSDLANIRNSYFCGNTSFLLCNFRKIKKLSLYIAG